jgi:hypothetical protein
VDDLVSAPRQTQLAADDVLISLGIMTIVGTEEQFTNCDSRPDVENSISVEPGGQIHFVVTQEVTATMARFFDLYSRGFNDRVLPPGNYSAILQNDSLGGSLHVQFSDSTAVLICE